MGKMKEYHAEMLRAFDFINNPKALLDKYPELSLADMLKIKHQYLLMHPELIKFLSEGEKKELPRDFELPKDGDDFEE